MNPIHRRQSILIHLISFLSLSSAYVCPSPKSSRSTNLQMTTPNISRHSFIGHSITSVMTVLSLPNIALADNNDTDASPIASFALRRAGALPPSLSNLPPTPNGIFVRFGEQILYSNDGTRTSGKDAFASFDFPADWLQLDRMLGGIQFVDQRNGDKLYLLKVPLPNGIRELKDVPKTYIGDAIFNPKGELVRTGNNVEEYKVQSSKMIPAAEDTKEIPSRRRFNIKYTTLTGNNFAVERKGIVDAYEYGGMIYMLMTGSNAVLFDKKGRERDTVEYIADSFRIQPVYGV